MPAKTEDKPMTQKNFRKVVRLGTQTERGRTYSTFAKIEFTEGKLSITGVEGPLPNGNAIGACGQIDMHMEGGKDLTPATGWTREMLTRFFDVWDKWHLNDMQAGCEHQRSAEFKALVSKEVSIYHWRMTSKTLSAQSKIEKDAMERLRLTGGATVTEEERVLLNRPFSLVTTTPALGVDIADMYEAPKETSYQRHIEVKKLGWLTPTEHPEGLLTKPCDVCGYKYGSAWIKMDVPQDVLDFLKSLPDTDIQPAWI